MTGVVTGTGCVVPEVTVAVGGSFLVRCVDLGTAGTRLRKRQICMNRFQEFHLSNHRNNGYSHEEVHDNYNFFMFIWFKVIKELKVALFFQKDHYYVSDKARACRGTRRWRGHTVSDSLHAPVNQTLDLRVAAGLVLRWDRHLFALLRHSLLSFGPGNIFSCYYTTSSAVWCSSEQSQTSNNILF